MASNCVHGCIADYLCGREPDLPFEGTNMAPWVRVTVAGGGLNLTVGNESDPDGGNLAVIKSFQIGHSSGTGCTVEIHDEEGGSFNKAMDKLNRCLAKATSDFKMDVQWGWVDSGCGEAGKYYESQKFRFIPTQVEASYTEGKIKFQLTGTSLMEIIFETRQNKTYDMTLKDAIKAMFADCEPKVLDVQYLRALAGGGTEPWGFGGGTHGPNGPKHKYISHNQNKLSVAVDWVTNHVTDRLKGIKATWNTDSKIPSVIFWEDPEPESGETSAWCARNIRAYVVNGGSCLEGTSHVKTPEGWVRIDKLVKHQYRGQVGSVDEDGRLVWANVVDWHRSLRSGRSLHKIQLLGSRKHYKNTCGGIFTNDHKLLTNRGYVRVDMLSASDRIHSGTMCPSGRLHEALVGIMLGNGHINKSNNSFDLVHCKEQLPYINHVGELLGVCPKFKRHQYKLTAKSNHYWHAMRGIFYDHNGRKTITEKSLKDFSLVSLAYLMMNDGSACFREGRRPRSEIAMCSYSEQEASLLIDKIRSLGIESYIRKNAKKTRVCFDVQNTKLLSAKIAMFVHPAFAYKLLHCDRDMCGTELVGKEEQPFFSEFKVIDWKGVGPANVVYCLGVEKTNNFITQSGVAHNCSPVIAFTPVARWTYAYMHANSGGAGGPLSSKTIKNQPILGNPEEPCGGVQVTNPVDPSRKNVLAPSTVSEDKEFVERKNGKANKPSYGMEAELRIRGDPYLAGVLTTFGKTIALTVINPFHIRGGSTCGDWLAKPGCNPVYSSKAWLIVGVEHSIKEGSYVTNIKLALTVPGSDIDPNDTFGGDGSGGWDPPTKCST